MLRSRFVAPVLGCIVLVAGCSRSSDDADRYTGDDATEVAASTTTTAEPTSDAGASPSIDRDSTRESDGPAAVNSDDWSDADLPTRRIFDAEGEVTVPSEPERIVVLDPGEILPTFLELGAPVVAANVPTDDFATSVLPADDLAGIESVGFPTASLELVAAADPDLIISYSPGDRELIEQLREVAPTVLIERDLDDWRASTALAAEAIGMAEEYQQLLDAHDERVASLAAALGDSLGDEVSAVRALGAGSVRMHTQFHFAGQVLASLGFARPPAQQTDDPDVRFVQLAAEEIAAIDGDVLFIFGRGLDDQEIDASVTSVTDSPLFDTLRVAQSGRVFVVDTIAWQQGGVRAADLVLADIADAYGVEL